MVFLFPLFSNNPTIKVYLRCEPLPVSKAPLVFRSVGIPLAKRPPSPPPAGAGGGLAAGADAVDDDCGMEGGAPMLGMGGRAIPPPPPEGLGFTSILF
jgi:hypothetical protein